MASASLVGVYSEKDDGAMAETPATYVIRLEFDHSTDVERTNPFDRAQLVPIYEELVALASENAEKGEVL